MSSPTRPTVLQCSKKSGETWSWALWYDIKAWQLRAGPIPIIDRETHSSRCPVSSPTKPTVLQCSKKSGETWSWALWYDIKAWRLRAGPIPIDLIDRETHRVLGVLCHLPQNYQCCSAARSQVGTPVVFAVSGDRQLCSDCFCPILHHQREISYCGCRFCRHA